MSEVQSSLPLTIQRRLKPAPTLVREAFKTSRLIEFSSPRELVAQTGHNVSEWPLVVLKELCDNSLDACEEFRISPQIDIVVDTERGEIVIADNGPGISAETVADICDYTARVSSREAYVSPTRGAQGNALKTILAMAFALDGTRGETVIETRGVAHQIVFSVNRLLQEPRLAHERSPSNVEIGTKVTLRWPDSSSSILLAAKFRFLQIADDFAWINPHLRISVRWDDEICVYLHPSDSGWQKWRACDQTSAHWYDAARFERYIAAIVARDLSMGRDRMIREFIEKELRGFSGSVKQKAVLDDTAMHRVSLSSLFDAEGNADRVGIARLLAACQKHSRPVQPKLLGLIGKDHLLATFLKAAVHENSFKYEKALGETGGLPWIVETAFGYCPNIVDRRRIIAGVNFSVGIGNPFRSFRRYGGEGLEALLNQLRAVTDEPIVYVIHYTHPRVEYTDRGKTALTIPGREG